MEVRLKVNGPDHNLTLDARTTLLGEIGFVGMNAAVANAVFHATRRRIRKLPIRLEDLLS